MEKISHIIPPSKRVTTVDTDSAPPVRPGAPNFNKKSGILSAAESAQNPMKIDDGDRTSFSQGAIERLTKSNDRQASSVSTPGQTPTTAETQAAYKNTADRSKVKIIEDLNKKFFSSLQSDYASRTKTPPPTTSNDDIEEVVQ